MKIKTQIMQVLQRLKRPSVLLSIVSQIISICILVGVNINENMVMAVATIVCSILVTLGIMSNPDTKKSGYGDDMELCPISGKLERHVEVNGQMVCTNCGSTHSAVAAAATTGADAT